MTYLLIEFVELGPENAVRSLETVTYMVDRVTAGLLINMDTERYFVRELPIVEPQP